ncbi:hypothetical protein FRB95_009453 [Tulasnella sp. JGI-2019a]|nr:hypothetical protein FRB95_009453 [Tulasnella sp. JGI-2019a]
MASTTSLPSPAERAFERAEIAYAELRWEDARRDYYVAWRLNEDMKYIMRLADVCSKMQDPTRTQSLERVIDACIEGINHLRGYAYDKRPKKQSEHMLELAGDAYSELGDYEKAVNAYNRSLLEKPDGELNKTIRDKASRARKALIDREQTPEALRPPMLSPSIPGLPPLPARPTKDFDREFQMTQSEGLPKISSSGFRYTACRWSMRLGILLVGLVDYLCFFGLGKAYWNRFAIYASDASNASAWREDQQKEWDRLATGLALLATMDAAILALNNAPAFSSACWLGGAAMSVCGIFIVQYIPVVAITMSDDEIVDLIDFDKPNPMLPVLVVAVTGPNAIACWSSALFVAGVIDYIFQNYWYKTTSLPELYYKAIVFVPVATGLLFVAFTLFVGDWVSRGNMAPDARLFRKIEKEQAEEAKALEEKRARAIEAEYAKHKKAGSRISEKASVEAPHARPQSQPQTEAARVVPAITAATALVTTDHNSDSQLLERARSLLESLLAQEPASDVAIETATAIVLASYTETSFPELWKQAVAVLEKAMATALATTSSSRSSLF